MSSERAKMLKSVTAERRARSEVEREWEEGAAEVLQLAGGNE